MTKITHCDGGVVRDTKEPNSSGVGRRQALKLSLAGALVGGGALKAAPSFGVEADPTKTDALVIGAGFAGVIAGRELSRRGMSTVILEARNRIGGRTFTAPFAGHHVDMGGTWFGPGQPHIWSEMTRYGVGLKESAAAGATEAIWWREGARYLGDMGEWAGLHESAVNMFFAPAREAFPRAYQPLHAPDANGFDKLTAQQVIDSLDISNEQRDLLESFAAINGHSTANHSSYLDQLHWSALGGFDIWNLWNSLSRYRADGGTHALIEKIQGDSNARLRLGAVVSKVVQTSNGITVVLKSGEVLQAKQLIVAVPLNCLNDIEFEPGLSAVKTVASARRHTGSGTKVYARIQGRRQLFLGNGKQTFPLCFAWTEYDDPDAQLLCGFGASPEFLDINDDEAVIAAFQKYVPDVDITDVYGYDWNLDPYSKGTWCMYPPGMLTTSLAELQRPEGAIHFAGSDIANGWRGFIDGAIETGLSSARAVLQQLNA